MSFEEKDGSYQNMWSDVTNITPDQMMQEIEEKTVYKIPKADHYSARDGHLGKKWLAGRILGIIALVMMFLVIGIVVGLIMQQPVFHELFYGSNVFYIFPIGLILHWIALYLMAARKENRHCDRKWECIYHVLNDGSLAMVMYTEKKDGKILEGPAGPSSMPFYTVDFIHRTSNTYDDEKTVKTTYYGKRYVCYGRRTGGKYSRITHYHFTSRILDGFEDSIPKSVYKNWNELKRAFENCGQYNNIYN